jgi:porin
LGRQLEQCAGRSHAVPVVRFPRAAGGKIEAALERARIACLAALLGCAAAAPAHADGVRLELRYTGEVIGVVSGGIRRGSAYEGRADLELDADLAQLAGWQGTVLHASAYQIHGYAASEHYVGNVMTVSNIEARPTTRLYSLWLQRALGGGASLRAGQLGADEEFMTSETASIFVNGTFGWAPIAAANMTQGGPGYPLATPGARLRLEPKHDVAVLVAAFAGDPAGSGCVEEPQRCNRYGTTFSTSGGTLWMSELQLAGGRYKLGGWYHDGTFAERRGNGGVYAIADRTLWRAGARALNAFLRFGGAPSDRNLVKSYVDAGLSYKGLLESRPDDLLALGAAHAQLRDGAESAIELAYHMQATPWLSLQPDLQYVVQRGTDIPDAWIVGLRASVRF